MKIFISYRRHDSNAIAGRIYDRLVNAFSEENIFKDVDSIRKGVDFRKALDEALSQCDVLLALIGNQYAIIKDDTGNLRLHNPGDFVRLEVETALKRNILVIPAYVLGASPLRESDLPESLKDLVYRNGMLVRDDPDFHNDMNRLIGSIKEIEKDKKPDISAKPHTNINFPKSNFWQLINENLLRILKPVVMDFMRISAGEFLMGSDPLLDKLAEENELPQHLVNLPEFWMGRSPVTNAQFGMFKKAVSKDTNDPSGGFKTFRSTSEYRKYEAQLDEQRRLSNHPVSLVTIKDAIEFCNWLKEQTGLPVNLPTEPEWEKAARGTDGRIYPWGNDFDPKRANSTVLEPANQDKTMPVGQYSPLGDSPYGCVDMAGNIWEWTRSLSKPYPYDLLDGREDLGQLTSSECVQRGGNLVKTYGRRVPFGLRCAARFAGCWTQGCEDEVVGFRAMISTEQN
jgi:formylglycine-generating enzyme required for sulfatase activity